MTVAVAELVRNGFVEGRHHGTVVALAADGSVAWAVGAVDVPVLPRSCAKPLQAAASGTRRDEAALLRAVPGAVGKAGAEACYAVALPDGRAVALKVEDGAARARPVVMAGARRRPSGGFAPRAPVTRAPLG